MRYLSYKDIQNKPLRYVAKTDTCHFTAGTKKPARRPVSYTQIPTK